MSPTGSPPSTRRTRRDRCPGVLRPWPAEDGLLVRLRLIGGRVGASSLRALAAVAERYGSGRIHVTGRANLQLRALPGNAGRLGPKVVRALAETGLLPSAGHELVRNVMVSPGTGTVPARPAGTGPGGGRADLRPVASDLDTMLCSVPRRADLPGRFLFVLDDGRGDLIGHPCDLGLVALGEGVAQLRIGERWGPLVPVDEAPAALLRLADAFLDRRGEGPTAPWHVAELPEPLAGPVEPDRRLPPPAPPLPYGPLPGGARHVRVPDEGLDRPAAEALAEEALAAGSGELVVTPWRGVLVPGESVSAPGEAQ
ncbi:nitrite reductase [Nocardiopsis tropica]|uniref:Nitrite reductase n=1 Tax=Nocardiopsis tropica TaxID=109330 RepID=A0ABU7L1S1_9ACTN|nr:nitrite reductase [Nocardiopsis umidischolae]MEE2055500.1 nitrite reductase [Nocardiopsis umidischolae]